MNRARAFAWGGAAALLYVLVWLVARPAPIRMLYDGLIPLPPYRWVHPPAGSAAGNQPAQSGSAVLGFGPQGAPALEVATWDNQALVTFPAGAVRPSGDDSPVRVAITPLDPATLTRPPRGERFDGNAYRIEATYQTSGTPAGLAKPATVVLEYPVHARRIFWLGGTGWAALPSTLFTGSQQLLTQTAHLGVFVAAAP